MEGEICSEEWEVVDYYCCNDDDDDDLRAKLQEEEEEVEKKKWWWWWWSGVGKKVVVTGVVISSAPVVIPPLLVVSALGFVMSLPFGVVFASYAATNKLMAKLLPPPPVHIPEEDYDDEIEGGALCNALEIKNHIHEDDYDEGVAINNAVEIQNHIQEEEEDDEEVVAINNAVEIQNHIQEEEEDEEVVAINNAVEIQNHIQEEEEEDEVVAIKYAVEIQNHIHEKEEEEEDEDEEEEVVAFNNAVEIKSLTQEEEEEEEKMSSEEDDIKNDGNVETRIESDGSNAVNHLQLGLHPESSSQNDNAEFDEEKSTKSGDQEIYTPAEIKQLGTILMNDDDTPLQKHDEGAKDAAETVIIQVHHHTETETVGGPTPLKTAEIDVTKVVVAADDHHSLELKEEKQSHHENISDEKIWEKINAIRVIVGFKAPKRSSYHEELKALYLYTGIEPPPPSASPSVADKLSFLMSVIGLK